MKINKLIAIIILVLLALLVCMVAGTWGVWFLLRPGKATTTVDVPVGDDMATQIKKGTTIYTTENVPAFVLDGTSTVTADFSATIKVASIDNTRKIRGEITSFTNIIGQNPEHNVVILYLCQPLSNKAKKLPDGAIQYGGNAYPSIITGASYDVVGVLQRGWQDYPLVYITRADEFKMTAGDNEFDSASSARIIKEIDADKMPALQEEVDNGHLVGKLDPQQVSLEFIEYSLNIPTSGSKIQNDEKQPNNQHNITVSLQDGRMIQLVLVQPIRIGPTGIWCVLKYRIVQ